MLYERRQAPLRTHPPWGFQLGYASPQGDRRLIAAAIRWGVSPATLLVSAGLVGIGRLFDTTEPPPPRRVLL